MSATVTRPVAWAVLLLVLLCAGCGRDPLTKRESYVFGTRVRSARLGCAGTTAAGFGGRRGAANSIAFIVPIVHSSLPNSRRSTCNRCRPEHRRVARARGFPAAIGGAGGPGRLFVRSGDRRPGAALGFRRHVRASCGRHKLAGCVGIAPALPFLRIDGSGFQPQRAVAWISAAISKAWHRRAATLLKKAAGVRNARQYRQQHHGAGFPKRRSLASRHQHPRGSWPWHPWICDGETIGTSGDYQRYFEIDGRRYCPPDRSAKPKEYRQGTEAVTILVPPGEGGRHAFGRGEQALVHRRRGLAGDGPPLRARPSVAGGRCWPRRDHLP